MARQYSYQRSRYQAPRSYGPASTYPGNTYIGRSSRKSRPSRSEVARIMRVVNSTKQSKFYQPADHFTLNAGGTLISLTNGMSQGAGMHQRIGNKIWLKSLDVKCYLYKPDGYEPAGVRVMLVRSLKSDPVLGDFPSTNQGPINRDEFFVFYDEYHPAQYSIAVDPPTAYVRMTPIVISLKQSLKNVAKWYDDAASQDNPGHVFLFLLPTNGEPFEMSFTSTLWYNDM